MTIEGGGTPRDAAMFRPPILDMKPYNPPIEGRTAEDFLRLDFNERTRPAHPFVYRDLREELKRRRLHLYPEYGDLDEVIANFAGVKPEQIIPTVGGDQAIDIIYRAVVTDGDAVSVPAPTFAMLEQSAHVQGAEIVSPRYKGPTLEFPFDEVMQKIKPGVKLVVICNPNNPTGTSVSKEQIELIIERAAEVKAGVLVDEAYSDFAPELTVAPLVDRYDNLYIVRSFSKNMGIAGLRAGYVISQDKNIAQLRKIRGPYDITSLSTVAMKALRYPEVVADIKDYVSEVMTGSKPMVEAFYQKNGIKHYPSSVGFHLLEFANRDNRDGFVDFLRKHNILVRPRSDPPNTVRVSIGTREDTKRYLQVLGEFLNQNQNR